VTLVTLVLLVVATVPARAAPPGQAGNVRAVTGKVVDAASGAPIDIATVLVDAGQSAATLADGTFTLAVPRTTRRLTVVAPGYRTRVVTLPPPGEAVDEPLELELEADQGSEVIAVEGAAPEQTKPTSYQLTAEDIRRQIGRAHV
jgi:hypothetical protein